MLASGKAMSDLGKLLQKPLKKLLLKQEQKKEREIHGHVIHIDHTGNIITNITQETFENSREKYPQFDIYFGGERISSLQKGYYATGNGDLFFIFNSAQLLEIGVRYGHAASLLGATHDTPLCIEFKTQDKQQDIPPA